METLSAGFPMYLLSHHKDKDGNRMTLECEYVDQYAPRKTGVHNVHLAIWKGKENPSLNQQWVWNAEDTSLVNVGTGSALFEGFNKNVIVYKWKGLANQRFKYNVATKRIENRFTGNALDVKADVIIAGQNIVSEEPDLTDGQQWEIQYQSEEHGHDHEHEE